MTSFDRKRYRTLIATKNTQLDNLPGRCNSDFLLLYFCLKSNSFCCAPNFNQNRMPLRYLPVACVSLCSMFPALVSPVPALGSRCLFCAKTQIESKLGRWIWTELFIPTFHLSSSGIPNSNWVDTEELNFLLFFVDFRKCFFGYWNINDSSELDKVEVIQWLGTLAKANFH